MNMAPARNGAHLPPPTPDLSTPAAPSLPALRTGGRYSENFS